MPLKCFYDGFISTFTNSYITSGTVLSETFVLDVDVSLGVQVISKVVSYIPFVGDFFSSGVEKISTEL